MAFRSSPSSYFHFLTTKAIFIQLWQAWTCYLNRFFFKCNTSSLTPACIFIETNMWRKCYSKPEHTRMLRCPTVSLRGTKGLLSCFPFLSLSINIHVQWRFRFPYALPHSLPGSHQCYSPQKTFGRCHCWKHFDLFSMFQRIFSWVKACTAYVLHAEVPGSIQIGLEKISIRSFAEPVQPVSGDCTDLDRPMIWFNRSWFHGLGCTAPCALCVCTHIHSFLSCMLKCFWIVFYWMPFLKTCWINKGEWQSPFKWHWISPVA